MAAMQDSRLSLNGDISRRLYRAIIASLIITIIIFCFGALARAGDTSGARTGDRSDIVVDKGSDPGGQAGTLLDEVGHTKVSLNFIWLFLGAILVFFMQAGFALVETGFCRKKNALHVMMTNFMIFGIGVIGFFLLGYALMFGGLGPLASLGGKPILTREIAVGGWGLIGGKGFALGGPAYDVGIFSFFLFQVVFMDTAATIPTGAMAERWKFSAFCVYGFFMAAIAYPVFGNWVWGGGWLSQLGAKAGFGHGFVDFAGSSVVHAMGGLAGLMGIIVLGPRFGKFRKDGTPRAVPGHNIPIAIVGAIFLVFGWFGFNAASTLNGGDLRLAVIAGNTLLASCFGSVTAMFYMWKRTGNPDPSMSANGALAGLVAITAPCAFVPGWAAAIIGIIAGILVCNAVFILERRFKIDDPVGAVAVHGMNGIWGVLALGIFADGTYGAGWNGVSGTVRGALYGNWGQLLAQFIGALTCILFACGIFYGFFRIQDRVQGIRVAPEVELGGLDEAEMGVPAYTEEIPEMYTGG